MWPQREPTKELITTENARQHAKRNYLKTLKIKEKQKIGERSQNPTEVSCVGVSFLLFPFFWVMVLSSVWAPGTAGASTLQTATT